MQAWNDGPGIVEAIDVSAEDYEPSTPFGCFWVGAEGDVACVDAAGNEVVLPNAAPGMWHPAPGYRKVLNSGTEATEIKVGRPPPR